jgi:hypothetical protein
MKVLFALMCLCGSMTFCNPVCASDPIAISDSDIDKILKAKEIVKAMVRNPDTLVFHEFSTKVNGNTVTLKFTCKNDFGVPETHTKDIKVN